MKRTLLTAAWLLIATISTFAQKYNIQGTWADGKGQTVYLSEKKESGRIMLDSTTVKSDGTFSFVGTLDEAKLCALTFDGHNENVFIADQPAIKATIGIQKYTTRKGEEKETLGCTVEGGEEQIAYTDLLNLYTTKMISKLGMMLALSKNKGNAAALDSLNIIYTAMSEKMEQHIKNKLDSCTNTIALPYFVTANLLSELDINALRNLYEKLTPRVKASAPAKNMLAAIERLSQVNIGGTAPDFTLQSPTGENVSLSALRGKVVLLDFWATWCGPCLRELPNVKALYEKYHSKGLEIMGVSLDDAKTAENWKKMVVAREMTWVHGSSLQGWECPVARLYNVTAIPRMYIIDREGKIIAQDLRGEELQAKMAEIFK